MYRNQTAYAGASCLLLCIQWRDIDLCECTARTEWIHCCKNAMKYGDIHLGSQ